MTTGGTGAEAALAQATVPLVGAIGGNGSISIVTVCTYVCAFPSQSV